MPTNNKHIILIGFKHVGKSVIGRKIAARLTKQFIDLDEKIEDLYARKFAKQLSCRQISKQHSEAFFRDLEAQTLQRVIAIKPAVISLGGGAPLRKENQELLKNHVLIYITATPEIVFDRIMAGGIPSFFVEEDPLGSFKRLWEERQGIYQELATFSVDNSGELQVAVGEILEKIEEYT